MIEILRLKNGEDIIGEVYTDTGDYEILEPMTVGIETRGGQSGLVMQHWLPVQLIEENRTFIKKEDVLTKFTPNDEFVEYYLNTVEKIKQILEAKKVADSMSDEEIQEAINKIKDIIKLYNERNFEENLPKVAKWDVNSRFSV